MNHLTSRLKLTERIRTLLIGRYEHWGIVILFALSVLFLIQPIFESVQFVERNHNEGWNAGHAARALAGDNIYDNSGLFLVNHYPPLSFYIIGSIGALLGDMIIAGRIISFISLLVIGVNVLVISRAITNSILIGILSSLIFITVMSAYYHPYIGMNDPHIFGNAVMLSAFAIFVTKPRTPFNIIKVALLVCIGGFIKHSLISIPLTITLYTLFFDRRTFIIWILASIGVLSVAFSAALLAFGYSLFIGFFPEGLAVYSTLRMGERSTIELYRLQTLVYFWAIQWIFFYHHDETWLIGLYVLIALLSGVGFSGMGQVNFNVFFDLAIALSISSGIGLSRFSKLLRVINLQRIYINTIMKCILIALCFGFFIAVPVKIYTFFEKKPNLLAQAAATSQDVAYLKGQQGPAICQRPALCYWSDKGFEFDFINAWSEILSGSKDLEPLLNKIRKKHFDVIQLKRDSLVEYGASPLIAKFFETLSQNYEIDRITANGFFYTPKYSDDEN